MKKWHLTQSEKVLYTPWLSVYKNNYRLPNGTEIDDYYVIKRSDFVLVVPVISNKLILVRQYRPATDQFYLALPAGYLHENESPEMAAQRELEEETGATANSGKLIGELHPLSGYIQSKAFVVLCDIQIWDKAHSDEVEISEVVELDWATTLEMIMNGRINEMQAVAAILMAKEYLARENH